MGKTFGDTERKIKYLIQNSLGQTIVYESGRYKLLEVDKPSCPNGEPKTDIYIRTQKETGEFFEFKISIKQPNADFIENKMSSERAKELLGNNWSSIVEQSTRSVSQYFDRKKIIFKTKDGHTDRGSYTLGWKYEFVNKKGGELSGLINLSNEQLYDVYSGTNLPEEKKNSYVNGRRVLNSGVANYILETDGEYKNSQSFFNDIISIRKYLLTHKDLYFVCKALNYRSLYDNGKGKYDGDRPLSVYVDWGVKNGKLTSDLVFDRPLINGGNTVYKKLMSSLKTLNISSIDDIKNSNVENPSIIKQ